MRILAMIAIMGVALTAPVWASETVSYNYDALGRLVKVVHSGTVNNNQQTAYTHDAADNRTNVTVTGAPH